MFDGFFLSLLISNTDCSTFCGIDFTYWDCSDSFEFKELAGNFTEIWIWRLYAEIIFNRMCLQCNAPVTVLYVLVIVLRDQLRCRLDEDACKLQYNFLQKTISQDECTHEICRCWSSNPQDAGANVITIKDVSATHVVIVAIFVNDVWIHNQINEPLNFGPRVSKQLEIHYKS